MAGGRKGNLTKVASLAAIPDGFGHWIARHLEWMRMKNYSEATVQKREPWLVAFAAWCAVRAIHRPREVTKPIIERYRRQLYLHRQANGKPLTFGSQMSRLAPLRLFFSWMTRQNALLWNPASELDLPRVEKRLPRALTEREIESILAQPDVADPRGLRDRAMMETLYSTGMRRIELMQLTLADLAGTQGTVFIRQGKGKKDRMVPIGERAITWVNKYLADARPLFVIDDTDTLFVSELGVAFGPEILSRRVRKYVEAAKVQKYGSCHLFRHTMATLMLEGGADIRFIQEILGHTNLETTQLYTRVSIRALQAVHNATHPGARLQARPPSETASPVADHGDRATLFSLLAADARAEGEDSERGEDVAAEAQKPLGLGLKKTQPESRKRRAD